MNPTGRNRQIDRAATNNVAFARIGPALVEIHIVPAASQVRCKQSTGEAAADENELSWHQGFFNRGFRGDHGYFKPRRMAQLLESHLTATERRGTPSRGIALSASPPA